MDRLNDYWVLDAIAGPLTDERDPPKVGTVRKDSTSDISATFFGERRHFYRAVDSPPSRFRSEPSRAHHVPAEHAIALQSQPGRPLVGILLAVADVEDFAWVLDATCRNSPDRSGGPGPHFNPRGREDVLGKTSDGCLRPAHANLPCGSRPVQVGANPAVPINEAAVVVSGDGGRNPARNREQTRLHFGESQPPEVINEPLTSKSQFNLHGPHRLPLTGLGVEPEIVNLLPQHPRVANCPPQAVHRIPVFNCQANSEGALAVDAPVGGDEAQVIGLFL